MDNFQENFHLWVNHFPVVGTAFVGATGLYALVTKSAEVRRFTYWAGLGVAVAYGVAYISGEWAHDAPTFTHAEHELIEIHEEIAEMLIWQQFALAAFAALNLRKENRVLQIVFWAIIIGNFITVAGLSHTGGAIRRPFLNAPAQPVEEVRPHKSDEH